MEDISPRAEARFWAKVQKGTGCWLWTACRDSKGYGMFHLSAAKKSIVAHRVAWMLANDRRIPDDFNICHHCDNPSCVNPDHLFLGRDLENGQDKARKGRAPSPHVNPKWRSWLTATPPVGERNPKARLTWAMVDEIRHRYTTEHISQPALAASYGVKLLAINRIICGHRWKLKDRPASLEDVARLTADALLPSRK